MRRYSGVAISALMVFAFRASEISLARLGEVRRSITTYRGSCAGSDLDQAVKRAAS
jgi:hypothetical protein